MDERDLREIINGNDTDPAVVDVLKERYGTETIASFTETSPAAFQQQENTTNYASTNKIGFANV